MQVAVSRKYRAGSSEPQNFAPHRAKVADKPLTLHGSEYAHAVQELNKAIDRAEALLQ
jgi:hypothetical protein